MKLALGGDSAGEPLVKILHEHLKGREGIEVTDLSRPEDGSAEYYANLADRVGSAVIDGRFDRRRTGFDPRESNEWPDDGVGRCRG